eukprot:scaffold29503_cov107-Isochrysis_galbana.AAC.1
MRWRKEIGRVVSQPSHRSDTARTKYWGGSGSWIGMVKVRVWSSSANLALSSQSSEWRMCS